MTEEPTSIVRLQAENIDLRQKLSDAENRLDKLFVIVTQAAVRDPATRQAVSATTDKGGDTVFFKKLSSKVNDEVAKSPNAAASSASASNGIDAEAVKAEIAKFAARIEELEAELATTKRQLENSQKAARDLDRMAGELEKERDHAAEALVAVKKDGDEAKAALAEAVARAAALEADVAAEVARQVEEGVFSATMELEDQIDALKTENANLRETVAANLRVVAERDAAIESAKVAVSERNIAVHVKDGAIDDAKALRTELAKRDQAIADKAGEVEALEAQLAQQSQNTDQMMQLIDLEDRVTAAEAAKDALLARAESAERDAANLRQQCAASANTFQKLKEERDKAEEARAELELRCKALQQRVGGLSRERDSAVKQRDAAFDASTQRAQVQEREKEDAARRSKDAMERLQAKYKDSSQSVKAMYDQARATYEKLIEKLQGMADAESKEELICDLLFDYERRIWLLQADVASLRTVADLRESDVTEAHAATVEEALSKAEMLRMQLTEAGIRPYC